MAQRTPHFGLFSLSLSPFFLYLCFYLVDETFFLICTQNKTFSLLITSMQSFIHSFIHLFDFLLLEFIRCYHYPCVRHQFKVSGTCHNKCLCIFVQKIAFYDGIQMVTIVIFFFRGLLFMQANKRETLELFWAGKRFSPFIKGVPCCTIHTAEQKYKSQCLVSNNGYADMLIKLLLIYYQIFYVHCIICVTCVCVCASIKIYPTKRKTKRKLGQITITIGFDATTCQLTETAPQ